MLFFGIGMKTDVFQSCGHCWVFQICWHIECSTFTASSFRIINSSAGIPLPPLTFFVVMLPKASLTSHSRISGSRWMITPFWLSGLWRSFLYSSSVYSCHLSLSFMLNYIKLYSWIIFKCFLFSYSLMDFLTPIHSPLTHSLLTVNGEVSLLIGWHLEKHLVTKYYIFTMCFKAVI